MSSKKTKPNLFIIGAPKCGTTSMMHYLSQHPEIFVSPVKEPHYFNTDSGHRYYFEQSDYLHLFSDATPRQTLRAEGSVWYLYSEVAIMNILGFNPDAKFIIMLRDPVSMFFSLHQELLFGGSEDERSALRAWYLQVNRKGGKCIPLGCSDQRFLQYGDVCSLGTQLKNAMEIIPPKNLLYIFMDDLRINPDTAYTIVQKFLGVTGIHLNSYEVVNKKKVRKSYLLAKTLIAATNLKKKLGLRGGLGIANAINNRNVSHDVSLSKEKLGDLNSTLYAYFEEDIALLEKLTGRDLSRWRKPSN